MDIKADFRLLLQKELSRRCEKNPSYSLRAFARHLEINPATLSSMIAGKRSISNKTINKLSPKLMLSPEEQVRYLGKLNKRDLKKIIYDEMKQDLFSTISDWYHDAILELTRIKNFQPDHNWIAKALGISVYQVNSAVDRLIKLQLLEINEKGEWRDVSRFNSNTLDSQSTSVAMRKYQKQILEKSLQALESIPRTERDHTSMMVCGNEKDLAKAKKMITAFRRELAEFFQRKNSAGDNVYQISISLFPLAIKDYIKK